MSFNYSSIIDDGLSRDDPLFWSRPSPVDCNTIRIVGIFLCIASLVGIVLNGTLVCSFIRYKALRTPPNVFIMFIAGLGLLASCTILPSTGASSIYCRWLFNRGGCQFEAIMAFLYGCSSSYLLCAVSLSRCYIIIRPFNAKEVTVLKCIIFSSLAVLIAFIWTMFPIIGWNEYTMEGARTSCCINWYDRRPLYISFTLFLFTFVYCVPLIILLISNGIVLFGLKQMREKIARGVKAELSQKRVEMERRILKSTVITVCGFIFTWTPYAVTLFVSAFRGKDYAIPPLATFFCACFAKSSVMWIPMLYIGTSTQFEIRIVNLNKLQAATTSADSQAPGATANKARQPTVAVLTDAPADKDFSIIDEE